MANQITAWQSDDGVIFDDKMSALRHEALQVMRRVSDHLEDEAIMDIINNPHEVVRFLQPLINELDSDRPAP